MRYLGYIWTVVINLIAVAVALAIFSNLYSKFEIIVIALLGLIYISIQGFVMMYGKTTAELVFGLDGEFRRIRSMLRSDINDGEIEKKELEEVEAAKKKVSHAAVKMYINIFFMVVVYIIILWNLFGAL